MAVRWIKIRKSSSKIENPFFCMAYCCATPVAININEIFFVFMFFLFVLVFVRGRKVVIMIFLDLPSLLWWSWSFFKWKNYNPVVKIHQNDTRQYRDGEVLALANQERIKSDISLVLFCSSGVIFGRYAHPFLCFLWIKFHSTPVVRMQRRNNNGNRACDRRFKWCKNKFNQICSLLSSDKDKFRWWRCNGVWCFWDGYDKLSNFRNYEPVVNVKCNPYERATRHPLLL